MVGLNITNDSLATEEIPGVDVENAPAQSIDAFYRKEGLEDTLEGMANLCGVIFSSISSLYFSFLFECLDIGLLVLVVVPVSALIIKLVSYPEDGPGYWEIVKVCLLSTAILELLGFIFTLDPFLCATFSIAHTCITLLAIEFFDFVADSLRERAARELSGLSDS
jgi:hypothetical protein